jgi:putative transcriptional regulator
MTALLSILLGRLDERAPAPPPLPSSLPPGFEAYPAPLREVLGQIAGLRWRTLLPGLRVIDLPLGEEGITARLLRFRRGFVVPLHDHAGPELTVVLSGSIADDAGAAVAGDVIARDPGDRHTQKVGDAPCVALVVNEGPLVPLTRWGRLLQRLAGV